ncbi:MAG: bifunctional 4-hydroxy-3-methylbut-2-enyl diphosphate reductase/30S ribosomal protein S1 [Oscillospiraceae bacterium]|nr:bifunctional 4-hydroxy-3-methylbut-2-enyl diphosphate reductase/30S ribosomal protein S1 [Oscillospiraceae bacterium]
MNCLKKTITIAESAGFCFGVKRSVEMAEREVDENGPCKSFGPLIHNEDVIRHLEQKGLSVIHRVEEAAEGEHVIIRAHGAPPEIYDALKKRGTVLTDATCPKVKHIHAIVQKASEESNFVFIIGMREHPEVEAISGYCSDCFICEDPKELEDWFVKNGDLVSNRVVTVVSQTTQTRENYLKCCECIKKRCTNTKIFDTICFATSTRQAEAEKLATECDAVVVIGGKHSANSIHLAEICRSRCSNTQFITNAEELDLHALQDAEHIAVTAGASTPSWIIKEVRNKMDDEIRTEGLSEEIKEETPAEPVAEKEPSFDEMLEESLKPIYNGDKVTGIVAAISGTEVSVDLGTKYSGFIPTAEFTDAGEKVEDAVKVGDTVEAIVVRVNDVEGTAQLSKKRLDATRIWTDLEAAVDSGEIMEGVVTEENKGGVVVNIKGVRVFVPASQTDLPKEAELGQLLKQAVRLKITEVNKARKRVVGSIRRVAQAERRAQIENFWNEIAEGKRYKGVVKSLTGFGAFVDLGGVDGMVHVSELSWGRIRQPSEVVSVGDEIEVYVIGFDKEKKKISLGYKDPDADPWKVFMKTYSVGDVAKVRVVKLMDFGAFAEVVPGVDGLIHISQIANRRIEKPGEVLTVGDEVEAKITAVDEEKQKISLSIRALSEPAPASAPAEEEESAEEEVVFEISETGEVSGAAPEEDTAEE